MFARPFGLLFDRDGTLIDDVPYNGDPALVRPVDGVRDALDAARQAGARLAVVTNQSGIGRGILDAEDVARVNARMSELLGPFDLILVCPHHPADLCSCRKPEPGLLRWAASELRLPADRCTTIGDRSSDMLAAQAAGMKGIRVSNTPGDGDHPTTAEAIMSIVAGTRVPSPR